MLFAEDARVLTDAGNDQRKPGTQLVDIWFSQLELGAEQKSSSTVYAIVASLNCACFSTVHIALCQGRMGCAYYESHCERNESALIVSGHASLLHQ